MSQDGTEKNDKPTILPEQNAEAVMPTVWAMRMAAGRGAIVTRLVHSLVDTFFV